MALKTMLEDLRQARAAYDAQLQVLSDQGEQVVGELLGPLVPPGYAIEWTQYTDYFNDGESCTFSVHDPRLIRLKPESSEDDDADSDDERGVDLSTAIDRYGVPDEEKSYETNDYDYDARRTPEQLKKFTYPQKTVKYIDRGFPAIDGYLKEQLLELQSAWDSLPQDLMEQAFGDHVKCRVDATGVTTDDHSDHD